MSIAATKISAGVSTGIGSHSSNGIGDEQFEIDDGRTLAEIFADLKGRGLQPVMADYVFV
jgi:2-iminoacetate synthase